jgi:hypothetical protein
MHECEIARRHQRVGSVLEQLIDGDLIPAIDRPTPIPPYDERCIGVGAPADQILELAKLIIGLGRRRRTTQGVNR